MNHRLTPRSTWADDSMPSRLEELTYHARLEQREKNAIGWRRNVLIAAAVLLYVAVVALLAAR